jgi:ATP-dependent helicase HrpB
MIRNNPNHPWAKRVTETAGDLFKRLYAAVQNPTAGGGQKTWSVEDETDIGELLAEAFPDRIARRRKAEEGSSNDDIFRFVSGREGRIHGPLVSSEWIVAAEVDAGERTGSIRLAAPVSAECALRVLENQTGIEKQIQWKGLVPRTVEIKSVHRLVISEKRRQSLRHELPDDLGNLFKAQGIGILPWEDNDGQAKRLLNRIRFFAAHASSAQRKGGSGNTAHAPAMRTGDGAAAGGDINGIAGFDAWGDDALIDNAASWLGPFIWDGEESGKGPILNGKNLSDALAARLGWETKNELDKQVREFFTLPNGRRRLIDYSTGEPVLSIRLQDAFGIQSECTILSVPVVFHLLSPADRPIQVTRDLAGFWKGSYAEVRKEMRGRYPKHHWPEIN